MKANNHKTILRTIRHFDRRGMPASIALAAKRYLAENSEDGVVWFYYGISLVEMARYSEGHAALRQATRLCPPSTLHLVYYHFGHLHQQRGAMRASERWFRKAIAINPSDATGLIFLGALLAVTGRLNEAEAVHRRAVKCKKGCIDEAYLNLGFVLRALGRFAQARRCFQKTLAIDPKDKSAIKALRDVEHVLASR